MNDMLMSSMKGNVRVMFVLSFKWYLKIDFLCLADFEILINRNVCVCFEIY